VTQIFTGDNSVRWVYSDFRCR